MKKLMIATPAYSGKVDVQYTVSLVQTVMLLAQKEIEVRLNTVTSGTLLAFERNNLLQQFYESECTHLLCIDSDLGWPAEAVVAMLDEDREIVGGVYPARNTEPKQFTFRPYYNSNGSIHNDKHLLKMQQIPAGFMMISREALTKMRNYYPELYYSPQDARGPKITGYALFNTEMVNGDFMGEDFVFCMRAIKAGVEIWCDPQINFNHAGTIGCVMECFTQNPEEAAPQHIPVEEAIAA
jgi:hypothetical protein